MKIRQRCLLFVLMLVAWLASGRGAAAQDAWEFAPYSIQVYLTVAPGDALSPAEWDAIAAHLRDRADTVVGGAWKLKVDPAPAELIAALGGGIDALTPEQAPALDPPVDKIMVLTVSEEPGPRIMAREFDVHARQWSPTLTRHVAQRARLPREAFLAVTQTFATLARVEQVENKDVLLRLRAEGYAPRDPAWQWTVPGDAFRGVMRANDRAGKVGAATEIPWTLLDVTEVLPTGVLCQLESGIRGALGAKRGRFEVYALLTRPANKPSRLELRARTPDARPLAGYDVYATDRAGQMIERLGRSDRNGAVTVPPGAGKYRILLIKDGQELLGRLPVVPGIEPVLTARIPDDAQRLEVEAFVVGMQESVVDLVARRAVLLARAETKLDANDPAGAAALIEEARRMETRDQLQQRISVERRRFVSDDPMVQKKIDRLFDDTTKLLAHYLDPADIELLQRRLRETKQPTAAAP